jgi:hypothetical protein
MLNLEEDSTPMVLMHDARTYTRGESRALTHINNTHTNTQTHKTNKTHNTHKQTHIHAHTLSLSPW